MLRQNNFTKLFNVRTWLAVSENGKFQVCSAIYKNSDGRRLYTYYDYSKEEYITEVA